MLKLERIFSSCILQGCKHCTPAISQAFTFPQEQKMIVCTGQRTFILDAFFRSASQLTGYIHEGLTWICKVASLYCIFVVNGYDG